MTGRDDRDVVDRAPRARRSCGRRGPRPGRRRRRSSRSAGPRRCSWRSPSAGAASSTLRSWAPRRPSASSEISMPGAIAPPTYWPLRVDHVERGRGAEVDDDRRAAVEAWRRRASSRSGRRRPRGGCPSGPGCRCAPRARPRSRCTSREVPLDHVAPLVQHRRDGRAHRDAGRRRSTPLGEQAADEHRPLVGGAPLVGGDPPVGGDLVAVEQAEEGVAVADVGGEEASWRRPPGPCRGRTPSTRVGERPDRDEVDAGRRRSARPAPG